MPRARDLGIPLRGEPGEWNAITDVPGVEVGYETLISGDGTLEVGRGPVRTGVTAVLPLGRAAVGRSCPAGWYSLNGNGEMTGTAWLDETGALSLPVGITNTHAVGPVHQGIIDWSIRTEPSLAARWHLPVVAETWDGYLNDINGAHVTAQTAIRALDSAAQRQARRGLGRRRHRDELLRLQGRHRDGVAAGADRVTRLHRRHADAGQLRQPRGACHGRPLSRRCAERR